MQIAGGEPLATLVCRTRAVAVCKLILATGLLMFLSVRSDGDDVESASEQSIKAAYLYRIAEYVEWPREVLQDPPAALTIGVLGADSLARELEEMTSARRVQGRPIAVKRVRSGDSLGGIHVLFIAREQSGALGRISVAARQNSTLLVTDFEHALDMGSAINFRPVDQRIRFEVSLDSADRSRLRLSSRLLAVAERVRPRTQ